MPKRGKRRPRLGEIVGNQMGSFCLLHIHSACISIDVPQFHWLQDLNPKPLSWATQCPRPLPSPLLGVHRRRIETVWFLGYGFCYSERTFSVADTIYQWLVLTPPPPAPNKSLHLQGFKLKAIFAIPFFGTSFPPDPAGKMLHPFKSYYMDNWPLFKLVTILTSCHFEIF